MKFFSNAFFASLLMLAFPFFAYAEPVISNAAVKMPVPGQEISAGYFTLVNDSDAELSLVAVSSSDAEKVEMHTHEHANGMMAMRKLDSVSLAAGETVEFVPGGHHLMVFSVTPKALDEGVMNLVFEFDDGETMAVQAVLEEWR